MNLIQRFRRLWKIAENYSKDVSYIAVEFDRIEAKINERTTVHADIHMKSPSIVIVVGQYRGGDYVRAFEVPHESLKGLIDHLKHLEPHARVGRMDMMRPMKFSAFYPRERF